MSVHLNDSIILCEAALLFQLLLLNLSLDVRHSQWLLMNWLFSLLRCDENTWHFNVKVIVTHERRS